ncbi:hypothetical protein ACFP81_02195 [Deinococcus lacus]|uniref:Copper resistance protein D domain-containing protein n=1 Tax=Deinococcus lacus TaxID=392561 RepID=A0ABW1YCL8_9DEIO
MTAALTLLWLAGLVLLLGGTFARRTWPGIWPLPVLWAGLALLLAGLALAAGSLLGSFGALDAAGLAAYWLDEPQGCAALAALIGALVLLAGEQAEWPWPWLLLPAALLLGGLAFQGHAALHGWASALPQALHLGAMSVWLGECWPSPLAANQARQTLSA